MKRAPISPTSRSTRLRSDAPEPSVSAPLRKFLEGGVEMVLLGSNRLSIEGSRTTGRCVSESPYPLIASP